MLIIRMYGATIISFDEFMGAVQGICAFQFTNVKNDWRTQNLKKKRKENFFRPLFTSMEMR